MPSLTIRVRRNPAVRALFLLRGAALIVIAYPLVEHALPVATYTQLTELPCSLILTSQAPRVTAMVEREPLRLAGADGRLTHRGTRPVMIPPVPSEVLPRPLPPLNASSSVLPAGMLPLFTLTETERRPWPFTATLTRTPGCGTGGGRGSDPIGRQPGRTGTTTTRACILCKAA